uniref:glutathione transferase n=1 Tax=Steinernema glaseri TaxID=37863 RepID=A0A1I8A0V3_9BILA
MVTYKLYYFEKIGARAEIARLLFAYANLPYEEIDLTMEELKARKDEFPFGQLPVLEVDGKKLAQSLSIARYLAKTIGGLSGNNDFESAQIDMWADWIEDIYRAITAPKLFRLVCFGEAEKHPEIVEALKPFLDRTEKQLAKNYGHLAGNTFSWADIAVADLWARLRNTYPCLLDSYHNIEKFIDTVYELDGIKEYVQKRVLLHGQ